MLKQHEKTTGRRVPYGVLLSRTSPIIRTRTMGHIQDGLTDAGVPMFKTQLHEREAFRWIFFFRQTLEELDPKDVPNLDKAIANAEQFAVEVIGQIRAHRKGAFKADEVTGGTGPIPSAIWTISDRIMRPSPFLPKRSRTSPKAGVFQAGRASSRRRIRQQARQGERRPIPCPSAAAPCDRTQPPDQYQGDRRNDH
ncbi:hypothetical protein [Sphingobium yanoikuyae]|uniref:hypothetical protein n=1 Tax=Sphingobium yanoikuyae TaxID=13690 RepID=UPI0028ACD435|nr:hypothetical protein [Sphingobium yanoikuyae]